MTEREVVLRERQAFADGAVCWVSECRERTHSYPPGKTVTLDEIIADAARKFPLPTVTRPRVVRDARGYAWQFVDGEFQYASDPGGSWHRNADGMQITPERVRVLADLMAQPTETVDA